MINFTNIQMDSYELFPAASQLAAMPLTALSTASKMEQARLEQAAPVPTMGLVTWDLPGKRVGQDSPASGGRKAAPLGVTIAWLTQGTQTIMAPFPPHQ